MRRAHAAAALLLFGSGCQEGFVGELGRHRRGDGPPIMLMDAGTTPPGADSGTPPPPPGTDAGTPPPPRDAGPPPTPDAGPPPPPPTGSGPCMLGPALAEPIAGCRPAPPPSTGVFEEDCVRRINQLRCECQHLQPLMRWTEGEACADEQCSYDAARGEAHAGFLAGICGGGRAQNECPGWGDDPARIVRDCLQLMWDEGPGDFYGGHGHYLNMSSTSHTNVACGLADGWSVQNFY